MLLYTAYLHILHKYIILDANFVFTPWCNSPYDRLGLLFWMVIQIIIKCVHEGLIRFVAMLKTLLKK